VSSRPYASPTAVHALVAGRLARRSDAGRQQEATRPPGMRIAAEEAPLAKENFMLRKIVSVLLAASFLALVGCNTMEGLGQDIEKGGQKLQNKAEEAK
jgi:entericidin B